MGTITHCTSSYILYIRGEMRTTENIHLLDSPPSQWRLLFKVSLCPLRKDRRHYHQLCHSPSRVLYHLPSLHLGSPIQSFLIMAAWPPPLWCPWTAISKVRRSFHDCDHSSTLSSVMDIEGMRSYGKAMNPRMGLSLPLWGDSTCGIAGL